MASKASPKAPTGSGKRTELDLLRQIRKRATALAGTRTGVRIGIGDDCALLSPRAGEELAVTTDFSIENRHFRLDWHTPEMIGHRALARGLSDLASMGARPVAAFLSLAVPANLTMVAGRKSVKKPKTAWIDRFYDGLFALAVRHKVPLAGGDLSEASLAVADIVLTGAVPRGEALLRSGARPGDRIYVTGALGGSDVAFHALLAADKPSESLTKRLLQQYPNYYYPEPRLAQGQYLRKRRLASAAMDMSDGLSTDLTHLCQESGVAAELEADWLPVAPGATLAQALHGGEDYELLFTAPANARIPKSVKGVPLTCIGKIAKPGAGKPCITLHTSNGHEPLNPSGWQHFR